MEERTKKGNKDGKILFVQMENENLTEFKIELDSVKISKTKNSKTSIILQLTIIFFIKSPYS